MIEKSKILKYYSIPILLFVLALGPTSYLAWKEHSLSNEITNQALAGNPIAIQILTKYEKPWKLDERVVHAAIEGNENAIKILDLKMEKH